jgi:hypothetical protein
MASETDETTDGSDFSEFHYPSDEEISSCDEGVERHKTFKVRIEETIYCRMCRNGLYNTNDVCECWRTCYVCGKWFSKDKRKITHEDEYACYLCYKKVRNEWIKEHPKNIPEKPCIEEEEKEKVPLFCFLCDKKKEECDCEQMKAIRDNF